MVGPPRINDYVHTQTAMLWEKTFGKKKKTWKMALSYLAILAVILGFVVLPPLITSLF